MSNCQFIAFHGWGFDDRQWKPWKKYLADFGEFQSYNRGYFKDKPSKSITNRGDRTILITHSFGLHWVSDILLEQADLLIITSGFLYFHPYAAQYKRRSRMVVQEMMNKFETHPEEVLKSFYDNCYAPQEAPKLNFGDLNHQLMLDDLQRLQNGEMNAEKLKMADKVCIIHGAQDHIVPNKKGRQLFTQLQDRAQYFEIKEAGHALPYTHYEQCLEFITPEVVQIAESE